MLPTSRAVCAVSAGQSDTLCERLSASGENGALVALSSETPIYTTWNLVVPKDAVWERLNYK